MNNSNLEITLLGKYGGLSKGLLKLFKNNNKYIINKKSDKRNTKIVKVATFCPTLRMDNLENYKKELEYYESLIKNLKENEHLIYISSITLELTNVTFYSQAKQKVEKMIKDKIKNYTILRLGMIFDKSNNRFTLASMDRSSKSIFTFLYDVPKTTACTIEDIFASILQISSNLDFYSEKIINVGLKRYSFFELQNISNYKKFRIPVLSFFVLKILSIISPRLRAYVGGQSLSDVPNLAFKSSLDH